MRDRRACNDAVIGISPFARPDAGLVLAVCAAGAVGVLDLGLGDRPAREALGRLRAAGRRTVSPIPLQRSAPAASRRG